MGSYSYIPLDFSKNEIRVLKFLDASGTDSPKLVHCILEHVSLDDYLPGFAALLAETSSECGPASTRHWMELEPDQTTWLSETQIPIAEWRRDPHTLDLTALGVDAEGLPKKYASAQSIMVPTSPGEARSLKVIAPTTFNFQPRFNWGDFEAVSYCWESDIREKTVIINGKPLRIAKSLEEFLQRLKSLPETFAGMRIWADGICIDQDDTHHEKNHQVALMKRIYTQAAAVIVWLGDPGLRSGQQAMKATCQSALVRLKEADAGCSIHFKRGPIYWDQASFHSWFDQVRWESVIELLSLNYWRRVWIIQELALNHNMTLFLYGDQQLSRISIWAAAEFCQRYDGEIRKAIGQNSKETQLDPKNRVADIWQLAAGAHLLLTICEFPETPSLETVLDLSRKSNAKKAQDKVYGILGLLPISLVTKNQPDYLLTPAQVYGRMARSLLEVRGLEELLSWCSLMPASDEPSWIPDWSQRFPRNHLYWLRQNKASKKVPSKWSVSSDGRILSCKGNLLDFIPSAESMSLSPSDSRPFRTQIHDVTERVATSGEFGIYPDGQELRAALERTLRMNHPAAPADGNILDIYWVRWDDIKEVAPPNEQLSDFWYEMRTMIGTQYADSFGSWEAFDRFRHTNADYQIFGHYFRDFFRDMREYVRPMMFLGPRTNWDYSDQPDDDYYQAVPLGPHARNMSLSVLALVGRKLATTEKGLLALVPEEAREGDRVAVLYGCNFPVLLRPAGDAFRYVGECYVDGLMDGEAIEAREKGDFNDLHSLDINII